MEALSATGSPGQEKRPRANIDILVSSSQAAAVLLKVVPSILVEVWHLGGEVRLRSTLTRGLPLGMPQLLRSMPKHSKDKGSKKGSFLEAL